MDEDTSSKVHENLRLLNNIMSYKQEKTKDPIDTSFDEKFDQIESL